VSRLDHLIFAAPDLDDGVREVEARFGVRASGGGQHPDQGTHNKVAALGPTRYLEVIAPDPSQPEPARPRPYGVDGITSSRLVGWALACKDIDRAVAMARSVGFDPGEVIEGHRLQQDGTVLRWRVTSNAQKAGVIPFLIDWGNTAHPATSAPTGLRLRSLHLEHPHPEAIVGPLRAMQATISVHLADSPAIVAHLEGPGGNGLLR
jgi:hypothetical protein